MKRNPHAPLTRTRSKPLASQGAACPHTTARRRSHADARRMAALTLVCVVLAACGGGGGDTSGATSPTPVSPGADTGTTPARPTSLTNPFPTPDATVVAPAAQQTKALDALAWVNYYRRFVGLAAESANVQVTAAAQAHSNYVVANNSYDTETHSETAGFSGFTGATPAARIQAAGYSGQGYEDMNIGYSGRDAVEGLMDAPLHRFGILGPGEDAGVGVTQQTGQITSIFTLDWGGRTLAAGAGAYQVLAYPRDGQTDVPVLWAVFERPSPAPDLDGTRIGYPITLQAKYSSKLTVSSLILKSATGQTVIGRLLTAVSGFPNAGLFLPLAPLESATRYSVQAVADLDGIPVNLNWSFTTQTVAPLAITTSASVVSASAPVSVTISGGAGRSSLGAFSRYSYQAGATIPPGLTFVDVKQLSATELTLTRNTTACVLPLSNCSVQLYGSDSSGATKVVVIPVL